jgi:hypothetical protein
LAAAVVTAVAGGAAPASRRTRIAVRSASGWRSKSDAASSAVSMTLRAAASRPESSRMSSRPPAAERLDLAPHRVKAIPRQHRRQRAGDELEHGQEVVLGQPCAVRCVLQ